MCENNFETMIVNANKLAEIQSKTRLEDRDIENRRQQALRRIAGAAAKWKLDVSQPEIQTVLQNRIYQAATARVSLAEAMADCAEYLNDFTSSLLWWDLRGRNSRVSLWKGYVKVAQSVKRIVFYTNKAGIEGLPDDAIESVCLSLIVRQDCHGREICSCQAQGIEGVTVGIGQTVLGAVKRAYVTFFQSAFGNAKITDDDFPKSLQDQCIDKDCDTE